MKDMQLARLKQKLGKLADPRKAKLLMGFFKTGKGEYGEGDVFLGISVPPQRKLAKEFAHLGLDELQELLSTRIHEHRMTALFILAIQFRKASGKDRDKLAAFYLKNTKNISNWDLVDTSAPHILGRYLLDKDRKILYSLARSKNLWEKRISMLSCFAFIREKDFSDALAIAEILLGDTHDLMHKAVGWMLREIGNKDVAAEEAFLKKHCVNMPRTMLRYAIEKFPPEKRLHYLSMK